MNDKLYKYYLRYRCGVWCTWLISYHDFSIYINDGLLCRNCSEDVWTAALSDSIHKGINLGRFMERWYDGYINKMRNEKIEEICQ